MGHSHRPPLFLFGIFFTLASLTSAATDADTLLTFKATLSGGGGTALANWVATTNPCKGNFATWTGLLCSKGAVWGLHLEGMNLSGKLTLDALAGLPGLRSLSFMNNAFDGDMPDVSKLSVLKSVFLSSNNFSGSIPDDAFVRMRLLKKLYLSQNKFTGPVPKSLAALPRLLELMIDVNEFIGHIPDLRQKDLKLVNVSYNQLDGPIPEGLSKMPANLFAGNKGLCGPPLGKTCKDSTSTGKKSLVATINY